ncbi:MAG TPA: hypothetical protein VMU38_09630 [Candidatus Binatia bacterium]|nr:hypothetical protein [Candidatus Binatia bacterium]
MRLSMATAASVALAAALLAGCSTSSQGTAIPGGATQSSAAHGVGSPAHFVPLPKVMTRAQVAQLHPSVLQPKLQEILSHKHFSKPNFRPNKKAKVLQFIMDDGGYIWGLGKKNKLVSYATDCSGAEGGVVDHSSRLVVACTNSSTVNIYKKGNASGPADTVLNDTPGMYPAAAFEGSDGTIYATNLYGFSCTTYYCYFYPGNVVWWSPGNQSSGSSPSGTYTDPSMYEVYFGDVDNSGNVYIDGVRAVSYGYGADEITGITTTAPVSTNMNIALNFPGGIYVVGPNSATPELSVNDQGSYGSGNNALYIYSLPWPGSLLYTDHSPQNISNTCDPVAGGYNKADTQVLIGDAGCGAGDLGTFASNTWKTLLNINFSEPIDGAFQSSDK